jgi:hypothetical protein
MFDFLKGLPDYVMPYLWLLGIALALSLGSMIWYGIYAWHEHLAEHPRRQKHRHRVRY